MWGTRVHNCQELIKVCKPWASCLPILVAFFAASCSRQNSDDEVPFPISPRSPADATPVNQPTQNKTSKTSMSPSLSVETPTIDCTVAVERLQQPTDGSEKSGALVRVADIESLQGSILVYRTSASSFSQGSFISVDDMIFGDNGTHGSGTYSFEFQTADGRACKVLLNIDENDVKSKNILNLNPTFP